MEREGWRSERGRRGEGKGRRREKNLEISLNF